MSETDKIGQVQGKALSAWMPEQDRVRLAALGKLLEELGELTAITARCIIQGVDEKEPETGKRNRLALEDELADVLGAMDVLGEVLNIGFGVIFGRRDKKVRHLQRWHALIRETEKAAEAARLTGHAVGLRARTSRVTINGRQVDIVGERLTYAQVVSLAGYDSARVLSVAYVRGRRAGQRADEVRQGTLSPGKSVDIDDGMVFNVADTSNA